MNLATTQFLLFLSAVALAYRYSSKRLQPIILLLAGFSFYALFQWRFLGALVLLIVLNFICGKRIDRAVTLRGKRLWLAMSLVGSLGFLGYLKYFHFFANSLISLLGSAGLHVSPFVSQILLPVGVSYYTFQMLTYTLDIYRQQIKPTKSIITFAAFSSFFPVIVAGPITRANKLIPQIEKGRRATLSDLEFGVTRFVSGYCKKVFIADTLAVYIVNPVFQSPGAYTSITLWLASAAYFIQIYADFSGYSSMAIGSARLLGFKVPENFAFPYLSRNIAEFWRRWHISLSRWLRDYFWWSLTKNIPFGGNWVTRFRSELALFAVFLVCGLWHGANWTYILWGALHGVYIVTYDIWRRRRESAGRTSGKSQLLGVMGAWLLTQLAVGFSFLLFRTDTVASFLGFLKGMLWSSGASTVSLPVLVWLAVAAFLLDQVIGYVLEFKPEWKELVPAPVRGLAYAVMMIFVLNAQPEQVSQFIYFKF
jgi:alginate O-acetyltransferase complex protein AlgI